MCLLSKYFEKNLKYFNFYFNYYWAKVILKSCQIFFIFKYLHEVVTSVFLFKSCLKHYLQCFKSVFECFYSLDWNFKYIITCFHDILWMLLYKTPKSKKFNTNFNYHYEIWNNGFNCFGTYEHGPTLVDSCASFFLSFPSPIHNLDMVYCFNLLNNRLLTLYMFVNNLINHLWNNGIGS
jgi:hypothetical protein